MLLALSFLPGSYMSADATAALNQEVALPRNKEREEKILTFLADKVGPELSRHVEESLESIESHPSHHLERSHREAICQELRRYDLGLTGKRPPSYSSRVALVEKELALVKPMWRKVWPENNTVDDKMKTFYAIWQAETTEQKQVLLANWEQEWKVVKAWTRGTWIKDTQHQIHYYPESLVGLAVVAGLAAAGEGSFVPGQSAHSFINDSADTFWFADVDFYAASAYAGGLPYELNGFPLGDPHKYREYWRWWLLEALPEAVLNIQKGYIGILGE